VTAGVDHLKYWYLNDLKPNIQMLESKSADLSKVKVRVFVGVQCLGIYVYALSIDGTLYGFNRERILA
jgi:hypothetical protein